MERVTGIGGVFFRATVPIELARWYTEHLGVDAFSEETDATDPEGNRFELWEPAPEAMSPR
jgi:hypothetical protein